MSWYNNNRNTTIKYKNAMNNLDKYQFALDQYDYGLPGEDDPEVQNIIAQQIAYNNLKYFSFVKTSSKRLSGNCSISKAACSALSHASCNSMAQSC